MLQVVLMVALQYQIGTDKHLMELHQMCDEGYLMARAATKTKFSWRYKRHTEQANNIRRIVWIF